MIEIMAGLSAAKQAIEIAQGLRALEKSWDAVELKSKIIDLTDKLQDVRGALQDAKDTVQGKDEELHKLRVLLDKRAETIIHNGFRYLPDPDEPSKPMGYPFCTRCDEVDHRLIHTVDVTRIHGPVCPQCKTEYGRGATRFLWKNASEGAPAEAGRAEASAIDSAPKIDQGAYVFGDSEAHYCTGCYDSSGRKSLLSENAPPFTVFGKWTCPVCKQTMGKATR